MPIYGRYEVVERLHATASVTVSRARLVDGKHAAFVVKVFQPKGLTPTELRSESQAFIDRVRLQEQLGARPGSHWAPIRHVAPLPTGAFFALDFCPTTLQSLVPPPAPIDAHTLSNIVRGIATGLTQLQTAFSRSHGDLKPANILLDRKRLSDARILLSDPATAADAKAAGAPADLRVLGEIIHALVLGRTFGPDSAWPIPDGPKWESLGPAGRHWQKLCGDLLATGSAGGIADLAGLRTALDEIDAIHRRPLWARLPRTARIAFAACVTAAVLGSVALAALDYSARRELAQARNQWLAAFSEMVAEPARAERYQKDPGLRAAMTDLRGAPVGSIDAAPTLGSIRPWNYFLVRDRLAAVERVRADLLPTHWQLLGEMAALADKLNDRGWTHAASSLRSTVEAVHPSPDLATAIDRALVTNDSVRRDLPAYETDWAELGNRVHDLHETGDDFLAAAGAMYQRTAGSAISLNERGLGGRDAIHSQSANLQQLLAIVGDGYVNKFNRARLQSEVVAKMDLPHLTPTDVQVWKDRLPDYTLRREETASAVSDLGLRLKQKAKSITDKNPTPAASIALNDGLAMVGRSLKIFDKTPFISRDFTDGTFTTKRRAIEAQIDGLGSTTVAVAIPATVPSTPRVTPEVAPTPHPTNPIAQATTTPTAPQTRPTAVVVTPPVAPPAIPKTNPAPPTPPAVAVAPETPASWVQSLPLITGSSDMIGAYWEDWKHVLRNSSAEMAAKPQLFAAMKTQTNGLHDALMELGKTFPPPPAGLSPSFTAVATERREREIGKALGQFDPKNPRLALPQIRQAADTYAAWSKKLVLLADDFPLRAQVLRLGQRPDLKWAKADPQFWSEPGIAALVSKDLERIRAMADLPKLSRSDLADAAASSTVMDVTFAAWELLGSKEIAPAWPTRPGELEAERDLRQKIAAMSKSLQNPDERSVIVAEIDTQGPIRWSRFTEAASSEQMLASSVDLRPLFGDPAKLLGQLSPTVRFNFALYQARQQSRAADNNGARQLAMSVNQVANELPDHAPVKQLIDRLATLDSPERLAEQNPGERYNLNVPGAEGGIAFQRVQAVETRPFYLATVDVSVGQFIGVVSASGQWDRISHFGWSVAPGKRDTRRGPRVWEWTEHPALSMVLPLLWLTPDDDNDYLPAYRITRFNRTALSDDVGGNPLPDHPMQQIPAEAALFYAGLCQSRLPTSAEWREAYAIFERTVPMERWNLRDQTFEAQRAYVTSITTTTQRWPDEAIFRTVGSVAPNGPDATCRPEHDGSLYFRTVNAAGGGTFHHLVGNVAQFVCDAPEAFDAWPDKLSVEGVRKFIQSNPGALRVIGGSALSPPEMPIDKPLPLAKADQGYADVGLRLAFTAPARSTAERLRWVLAGQKYLWEKSGAGPSTLPSEAVAQ